jgi:hypothetical protein
MLSEDRVAHRISLRLRALTKTTPTSVWRKVSQSFLGD